MWECVAQKEGGEKGSRERGGLHEMERYIVDIIFHCISKITQPISDLLEVSLESLPQSLVVWLPLQPHTILTVLCR